VEAPPSSKEPAVPSESCMRCWPGAARWITAAWTRACVWQPT